MILHPDAALRFLLVRHAEALGIVHGGLDAAIQETCAMWTPRYPDLFGVHANVFAGNVRQCLLSFLECEKFRESSLNAAPGSNCSVILSDAECAQTMVRKHPRSYVTGELVSVTECPADTLWGVDYSAAPWQPYVLWEADLKTQVLRHAWLAAVSGIDDPQGAVIYGRFDLPSAIMPVVEPPPSGDSDNDDWNEEFGEGEGEGPSDPA